MELLKHIVKELRINHYIKNVIIFIPFFFYTSTINNIDFIKLFFAFCSFCLCASAIYIFNDITDIKSDELHPIKSNRPIASKNISKKCALIISTILVFLGVSIAFKINYLSFFTLLSYIILNIFYSLILKNKKIIDAFCIALGFVLRILAGSFAINIAISSDMVISTFFISLFFTLSKRKLEMDLSNHKHTRKSYKNINKNFINSCLYISSIISLIFYFNLINNKTPTTNLSKGGLFITFLIYALFLSRWIILANSNVKDDDPIELLKKDKYLDALIFIYFSTLCFLYLTK